MREMPTVRMTQAELDALPDRPSPLTEGAQWRDIYGGVWYRVTCVKFSNSLGTTSERIIVTD